MKSKRAICIGINYVGTSSELSGCVNDARDWADVLTKRGYAVTLLLEKDATQANILREATELMSAKTALMTFSGHGTYVADIDGDEPDGYDEAICPVDVFNGNVITDDELYEIFNDRQKGQKVVFISDSCHSGTVSRFMPERVSSGVKVRFLPPGKFLPRQLRPMFSIGRGTAPTAMTSALLLSGCRDFEYSYDAWFDGRANGAMSRAALDAFATLPKSATYRQFYAEIRKRLPTQSYPQTPQLFGTSSQKRWVAL